MRIPSGKPKKSFAEILRCEASATPRYPFVSPTTICADTKNINREASHPRGHNYANMTVNGKNLNSPMASTNADAPSTDHLSRIPNSRLMGFTITMSVSILSESSTCTIGEDSPKWHIFENLVV